MDPYEFTQTVNEERHEDDKDDLKKLEEDLAPSAADYYGVLNISRKVRAYLLLFATKCTKRFVGYRRRS